jgi:hypothetical protein
MAEFHSARGITVRRGRGRYIPDGHWFVRWCFADAATADEFVATFGGTKVAP